MSESINIKPCPNLFMFRLYDWPTKRLTQIRTKVMCNRVKGHAGKCRVVNPNDFREYEVDGVPEELPESYFKQQ